MRIIYPHIHRTGGITMRKVFEDIYGQDRVYWSNRWEPTPAEKQFPVYSDHWRVVGGHKPLGFFHLTTNDIAISIVRNPVERAFSIFRYVTDYHSAPEDEQLHRHGILVQWMEDGLNPNSFEHTFYNCQRFRRIMNIQTGFFDPTCLDYADIHPTDINSFFEYLSIYNYAIYDFDQFDIALKSINKLTSNIRSKPFQKAQHLNGYSDNITKYIQKYSHNRSLMKHMFDYMSEDIELYKYLERQRGGIATNMEL